MKIRQYAAPGSAEAYAYRNGSAHHWIVDIQGDEYSKLIEQLRNVEWNQRVAWYPKFFPGETLGETSLEAHIVAYSDRDATMIRLLL